MYCLCNWSVACINWVPVSHKSGFEKIAIEVVAIRNSSHMAKILSVYNRLQAGDYEHGNGGKRRVSRLTQFIHASLQLVFCYELFVQDCMFLYLYWVRSYSEHDCYYTELERTGCHQRLLQFQPKVSGWRMRVRIECFIEWQLLVFVCHWQLWSPPCAWRLRQLCDDNRLVDCMDWFHLHAVWSEDT